MKLILKFFSRFYSLFLSLIFKVFLFLQFFLFLRLFLKFFGANPETPVVSFIYKYSDILISPFRFIFNDIYFWNRLLEMSTVSAMAGYAVVMFIAPKILRLFQKEY